MVRTLIGAAVLLVCGLAFIAGSHAQAPVAPPAPLPSPDVPEKVLPAGEHRALVIRACAVCHPPELVVAKRRTEEDWDNIIARMVERGAIATEDEQLQILDYLSKSFGL